MLLHAISNNKSSMEVKYCKRCDTIKARSEFSKDCCNATGLQSKCKVCQSKTRDRSEAGRQKNNERNKRTKAQPTQRITARLMNRMRLEYGHMNRAEASALLGASWPEVTVYLMKQVGSRDLSELNIDHIVPFSSGKPKEEVCHYTNLQMLSKEEHKHKSVAETAYLHAPCP